MEPINFHISPIERHRLTNGLTVLLREDHSVPMVSSMLWYRVGSRFEKPGITGVSHFIEHMMFKGTAQYRKGEIDRITACQGGSNNAFTSYDYTAYHFTFASDRWEAALAIESDRMINAQFDPKELELERRVIIEELKTDLDTPWGALHHKVEGESFTKHPYKFPIIGNYQDLVSISRDQIVDYYRQFYSPNNAILVLVGDLKARQTLDQVEKLFSTLPSSVPPANNPVREPRQKRQIRVEITMPTQTPRILLAFPAPSVHQNEHCVLRLLDALLSGGKLSRLYRRLVEKERIASVVSTQYAETFDPYLFFISAELHRETDLEKAELIIFEELSQLTQSPISEIELSRAKNQCFVQFFSDFETTLDQAVQIGLLETLDCSEYWDDFVQQIATLKPEEIQNVVSNFCSPERVTIGTLCNGPRETI
ncbi:MAG: pitrilysin family protein [Acidobacteriota bacterium]|nr:pitrilysin family protein [Acidobacteriota bacterium]